MLWWQVQCGVLQKLILNSCNVGRDEEALDYHEGVGDLGTFKNNARFFTIIMYVYKISAFLLYLSDKNIIELRSLNINNLSLQVFIRLLQKFLRAEHLIEILLYSVEEFNLDDTNLLIKEVSKIEHKPIWAISSPVNPT